MASSFSLSLYPWVFVSRSDGATGWDGSYIELEHLTPDEEAALPADEQAALQVRRNAIPGLPLVNYTTQYGMGCFEGLKAFPWADGTLRIFRPDRNAARMARSMAGLQMPAFPERDFVDAVVGVVARNADLGFRPAYDPAWEADNFLSARSIYIRPFSYSEPGIGLNLSKSPFFVVITTPVGSYFDPDASTRAVTTHKVRATRGGTGWIKCDANYVIPTLTKFEVQAEGFMEAIFLDAAEQRYVEEGSSCNIFFVLDDETLVTPTLEDTVLAGITRTSVMQLARDRGLSVEERRIEIDEVMDRAVESFVTGTAAGLTYLESITHKGHERVFRNRAMGDLTREMLHELKGIQYGAVEDRHGWMVPVTAGAATR